MSSIRVTTNFKTSDGVDLGDKLITKDYLMSVYPSIAQELGKTPELWTWGDNTVGQLGTNNTSTRTTPVTTFAGGTNWKQVSCGVWVAAIKTDGTLWTWGSNSNGQLGDNTITNRSTPVTTFAGGTNWKQVSCGGYHTAAIKTDGTLWVWGYNGYGQLGNNSASGRRTPVTTFAGGTNWKQVAGGSGHTAAIKTDGTLWVWGYNVNGELGISIASATNRLTPVTTFAGGTNWKQVACGQSHTAAIKTDGTLWTWGLNGYGQLGNNSGFPRSTPVTTFAGGTNWKQVSCGSAHVAAIKTDGTLWTWGYNSQGQLGINNTTNRSTPVTTFAGGTDWKQVSCGLIVVPFINSVLHNCAAIKTDGTLWTWGNNNTATLGTNNLIGRSTPVTTFAGGTNWKQVACGFQNAVAIKSSDFI